MSQRVALILDFGGVLTNNYWDVLAGFSRREGLAETAFADLILRDPIGKTLMHQLERGELTQRDFEDQAAPLLGVTPRGLLRRLGADLAPNMEMLAVIADLRASGVRTALLSNSWGVGEYDPYEPWQLASRLDAVVLSHEVGLRKPESAIFREALQRLDVNAGEAIFVDDIADYLIKPRELGIATVHHCDTTRTTREIRALLA